MTILRHKKLTDIAYHFIPKDSSVVQDLISEFGTADRRKLKFIFLNSIMSYEESNNILVFYKPDAYMRIWYSVDEKGDECEPIILEIKKEN